MQLAESTYTVNRRKIVAACSHLMYRGSTAGTEVGRFQVPPEDEDRFVGGEAVIAVRAVTVGEVRRESFRATALGKPPRGIVLFRVAACGDVFYFDPMRREVFTEIPEKGKPLCHQKTIMRT